MNAVTAAAPRAINIALLAMGGEGGGVLADWIVDLAEHAGWIAQTTSVPGVAQRTGATIYYVEIFPAVAGRPAPVLALMPFPGEVDVVVASELMESGRALQRGLVTADRTTLVASTHRVYSMTEKMAMGDGRVDTDALVAAGRAAAKRAVFADFARAAEDAGSVIGASLFGALAGASCLPFPRSDFEDAVRRAGVGVDASLKAFTAGFALATEPADPPVAAVDEKPAPTVGPRLAPLAQRVRDTFPATCVATILHGCLRLADYQDIAYAGDYVARLERLHASAKDARLLDTIARHLALWMSYEDTIRVADLKTRASRFDRVRGEVRQRPDQLLGIGEFLHPRVQEIADTLPVGLGRWLLATGWARRTVARFASKGRIVQTSSIRGFLLLYMVASLRRFRRSSLRFADEHARIATWLALIADTAQRDIELAIAVAECQRLVKGYGDTHVRGTTNYATLIAQVPVIANRADAADVLRQLRDAALADEHGTKLAAAIAALTPAATI